MKENQNQQVTRRGFLSLSATCLASAGLMGISPGSVFSQQKESTDKPESKNIVHRLLGRTKLNIPVVSMGVMNADNPGLLGASYELGMRHFDTAAFYQFGRNEQMVGSVIKRLGVRDKVYIGTKVFTQDQRRNLTRNQTIDKLISSVDASLGRLRTDYIDILYIHDVRDAATVADEATMEGLVKLKEQGKIRFAGVSTHAQMAAVINQVTKGGFYDVVLTSINFTMADDTIHLKAIADAAKAGVGIVAMKTLAGGSRWPNPDTRRNYSNSTIVRAALKWVLQNENIHTSIPGFDNYDHMNEDFSVVHDLAYTADEEKFLSDNSIRLGMGFCRQCRQCLASCPHGVDVPTLMRTHMYAAQYANLQHARATLDQIPSDRGLKQCAHCSDCTARCANTVDIAHRIGELKTLYA